MIRFSSCRKNIASVFRVTNVSSGRWSDIRIKCVSSLVYYGIGRSLEGVRFVVGQWEFRFAKTPGVVLAPTGRGKSYYLSMPNTFTPPCVTDTFLSVCHVSIHINEFSHPQDRGSWSTFPKHHMIQQSKRRSITALKAWKVTVFKTWQAMYISSNIVMGWRKHFA